MRAFLTAGGKGTRLKEVTGDLIPKPMAEIAGVPVLERAIISLKQNGVDEITISVGHLAEVIKNYVKDGSRWGVKVDYVTEEIPLGSGGALFYLKNKVKDDFVVCSGDTVFDVDIKRMLAYHKRKRAAATLFTHPNAHPYDSDMILTDRYNRITGISLKNAERNFYYKNNVNAGFFIISPATLSFFDKPEKVNMEHDFIASLIARGERVYAYKSTEYVKDVGTPDRFLKAEKEILSEKPAKRNLKNKQKAIFLDRDGTINVYKGFIKTAADIELLPHVSEAIKLVNDSDYLAVIVSNQPVIARGEATRKQVDECFEKIETLLGKNGAFIDGVYYCPHHPHSGFKGEVKRLKKVCDCRKPATGLLKKAEKDFNLDLSECYMIGDSRVDEQTALNAGIPCIKVTTGAESAAEPSISEKTRVTNNLAEAVKAVLGDNR